MNTLLEWNLFVYYIYITYIFISTGYIYDVLYIHIYTYHIFFIHLSVDGYLHYFHISTIINNIAMNFEVHVSFQFSVFIFFGFIPSTGVTRLYSSSSFSFLRDPYLFFSIMTAPIYISTKSVQRFPSLHMLSSIGYL